MVNRKKAKEDRIRITDESVEQVDNSKYLGCNISSNLNCYQELKQRIAMAKDAFNRKRSIFCGPLEKELRKKLMKCFVWSVKFYGAETWTLRQNEHIQLQAFEMWIWRRTRRAKCSVKIQNGVILERVEGGRIML